MPGRSAGASRSPARVTQATGSVQSIPRQRSLVEEDPDSERIPARTVCAAFSLLVLGLVRGGGTLAIGGLKPFLRVRISVVPEGVFLWSFISFIALAVLGCRSSGFWCREGARRRPMCTFLISCRYRRILRKSSSALKCSSFGLMLTRGETAAVSHASQFYLYITDSRLYQDKVQRRRECTPHNGTQQAFLCC